MFEKERISIDITKETISIISGTKYKVNTGVTIETPEDSFDEERIIDSLAIANVIRSSINKIKTKEVYFVLRGDDVISRQIELPVMKEEATLDSVKWELSQFVGDRVSDYVVSYEVISKKNDKQEGNCTILMIAVEKTKIEKYFEVARELKLKVVGIDIAANITARLFRYLENIYTTGAKSVGLIDISASYSSLSIIELGRMALDKFQGYGLKSGSNEEFFNKVEYDNFIEKIDLEYIDEEDFTEGRLENYLDSITTQFSSFIQFYSSGKVKKNLDNIYIIGSGSKVTYIDEYFQNALNAEFKQLPNFSDLKFSIKVNKRLKLKDYFYAYGMLLRNDKNDVNLLIAEEKKEVTPLESRKVIITATSTIVVLMALGAVMVIGGKILLNKEKIRLTNELQKNETLLREEASLIDKINIYTSHINFSSQLEEFKTIETATYIDELNKYFPSGIKVTNFEYTTDKIIISGTTSNIDLVEILWANLREVDLYKNSHIGSVIESNGVYTFTLEVAKGGGTVVE